MNWILISELAWGSAAFLCDTLPVARPACIIFPAYSQAALAKVLSKDLNFKTPNPNFSSPKTSSTVCISSSPSAARRSRKSANWRKPQRRSKAVKPQSLKILEA